MKRGFCHRTPMLAGCLPYLPHLPGICRTNSGEEWEEVPISLSSKLAISRYAAKYVLVMNCYRLLTWCAQPVLSLCPYFHSWLSVPMMQSDLAMSTEDRQSRQCMSQCPMTAPGALRVNSSWRLSAFCFPIHPQGTGSSFSGQRLRISFDWGHVSSWI